MQSAEHARAQLTRELCDPRQSGQALRNFARIFWPFAEPGAQFVDSWSFGAICEFVQAHAAREFKNGVINVPPGSSKSLITGAFLPVWLWSWDPPHRYMGVSHDVTLTMRDAGKSLSIMRSRVYKQAFPNVTLRTESPALSEMWNAQGGLRFATSVASKGIGWHFVTVSVDDMVKPLGVMGASTKAIENAMLWLDGTLPTRRSDPERFGILLTAQRLSENDPPGQVLRRDGWEHLCLPMHYQPKATWIKGDWSAKLDPRTEPEELLNPQRFPEPVVKDLQASLRDNAHAQLEQNPIPSTGGMVNEHWLRWEWIDIPYMGHWVQIWDLAAKGTDVEKHSAVHGALWCCAETTNVRELVNSVADRLSGEDPQYRYTTVPKARRYHLVDEVWGVWDFPTTKRRFLQAQQMPLWDRAALKRIEEKASGIQAIQELSTVVPGIVATEPSGDKIGRFTPTVPPAAEAGLILLPAWYPTEQEPGGPKTVGSGRGPDAFRQEITGFPRAARNDRADTTADACAYFRDENGGWEDDLLSLAGER